MDRTAVSGQRIVEFGLICLIVFSPLPGGSVHGWSMLVIQLAVFGLTAVALFSAEWGFPRRGRENSSRGATYLFFGFWIFAFFQCLPLPKFLVKVLSPRTFAFCEQYKPDFPSAHFASFSLAPSISIVSALALLPYFLIGFLVLKTMNDMPSIVRLFRVLFFIGVAEAVYGLSGFLRGSHFVSGTFINRNHFAGYMEMIIPLGMGLILAHGDRGKKPRIPSFTIAAGVIVMSLALLLTASRSGFLILIFVFVFFFIFYFLFTRERKQQRKKGMVLMISVLLIIAALSLYVGVESTFDRFSRRNLIRESRFGIWERTWETFTDFPLFGTGLGTFGALYPVIEADGEPIKISHAHNDYLEFLSELGVIGMGLLLGAVVFVFVLCLKRWRKSRDPLVKKLGFGGLVSVLALSLHGLTDFNLQIPSNILLFSVVLSLTYATVTNPPPSRSKE